MNLAAMVIKIRANNDCKLHRHMGLAVQRLFKAMMHDLDFRFNQSEHQPYSVSGVMEPYQPDKPTQSILRKVQAGDEAWIRFAGLSDEVIDHMREIAMDMPPQLEIDKNQFWEVVEAPIWDARLHPWAGRSTYGKLSEIPYEMKPPSEIRFEFATPTTFKSSGNWVPLPHPMLVFGSLDRKWCALAPESYQTSVLLPTFIEIMLPLVDFDCQITMSRGKKRLDIPGFVGDAIYHIRRDTEAVTLFSNAIREFGEGYVDDLSRSLYSLSEFAFFAGIGSKCAMGMGMSRYQNQ